MILNTKQCLWILCFFVVFVANAQEKRALTHTDYDGWESLSSDKISKDGKWIGFEINPQEGDGRLEIVSHRPGDTRFVLNRADRWSFSNDSKFAVGRVVAQYDTVRHLKLKKTKPDEMPKDSLFILDLTSGLVEKLAKVKSFAMPDKEGNWLAVLFEKEGAKKQTKQTEGDSTQIEKPEKPKKTDGTKLLVRSFDGKTVYEYDRVKSYGFSDNGTQLFYIKAEEDTLKNAGVFILDLNTGVSQIVDMGKTDYVSPKISESNKYLAFLATEDSLKAKKPYYDLYLYDIAKKSNQKIVSKDTPGILKNGMISKSGRISFAHDDSRLFFGTTHDYVTYAYEDDTTILDEERVKLDIWGWQDAEIQPMQLKNKSRELNRSLLATYNLKDKKVIQLADDEVSNVIYDTKSKHKLALGFDDSAYRRAYSWDTQVGSDIYLINVETGAKTLIQKKLSGRPSLSPSGKFAYWYDSYDSAWYVYDVASKVSKNVSKDLGVLVYNEQHDSPSLPGSYGSAGWLLEDKAFLVYDKYDIWKIDPAGKTAPQNITKGEGRTQKIEFRRQRIEIEEEEGIDPKSPLILTAFHEFTKQNGFYKGDINGSKAPEEILMTDHRYMGLKKAENSEDIILRRSTYQQYADVYASDLSMNKLEQISFANPKQAEVNWGSVELVDYLANDGTPLQGLLFKPENFDSSKKYPMMVYFYERNSDGLHMYRSPAPSASTINIPYFVSNDYLVFVPDIKYDLGLPGPSAYNCIIPGVQSIVARGFVDAENMAIQGQSWGGYQVAYLITRTNMFKAAGAGAPVVNMTSAYGGIRWGTGMSRMFQYEKTQSRIGGTLWEKPLYYIENSPLFFMDRVNTPVLIMHNDEDGAVPWYQGIEMFMALKRLDKPAWLLQYNGEDHNLVQRKNRKDLSIRLSQFFDHYLKGAPAPLWMIEGLPAVEKGRTLKYELEEDK
ncbi:prolyl oligopeptidase family serine peptidase [Belliella kenyensis]|uniref:Prolyl oligopeptidase family serine peptidase n=1 Tax=Belliella kenyensis TaxID=1472724 RepID=A0ABV8EPI4_9BACT|nr:prolyl oligopeptidase family serine peptidase [Belliella kenyensis]MCH7403370.1 prolyl oligopeptidase family serine peptidase [Belliella kenyensis]MDN3601582.1 prolyl oligopeptidase family serine peptidase [Belliella kenyensis]